MWAWAGSSESRSPIRLASAPILLLLLQAASAPAEARVFLSQEEALAQAFPPPARVERKTLFLDENQAARIERESGEKLAARVIAYYVGVGRDGVIGYAYFDRHPVRTLPETIMAVVRPDGGLDRITILSFDEPEDYLPKQPWLEQFRGHRLDDELAVRRKIRNLTGASLSARAITSACRRILAIHRLVARGTS